MTRYSVEEVYNPFEAVNLAGVVEAVSQCLGHYCLIVCAPQLVEKRWHPRSEQPLRWDDVPLRP
jgi:hypothetical protein